MLKGTILAQAKHRCLWAYGAPCSGDSPGVQRDAVGQAAPKARRVGGELDREVRQGFGRLYVRLTVLFSVAHIINISLCCGDCPMILRRLCGRFLDR